MDEQLKILVDECKWDEAYSSINHQLQCNNAFDDEFYILAASVCLVLNRSEEFCLFIRKGMQQNYRNYELYFILGNYYENSNADKAWLCYENAEYYCRSEEDKELIRQYKQNLAKSNNIHVRKTTIVILSYNTLDFTSNCLASIFENTSKETFDVIVVDNGSTDGSVEWLKKVPEITLICNKENVGFPAGCNQGIRASEPDTDIFLLNSDTLVQPNSIFWLRMGLYEDDKVGATGSVASCNYNEQVVDAKLTTTAECLQFALQNNVLDLNPYEHKVFLIGYALMLKRNVLNDVGLLDERFTPGTLEDDDIGVRLNLKGYQVILCWNSFIYHFCGGGGKNEDLWNDMYFTNLDKFKKKWGYDISYYKNIRKNIVNKIQRNKEESFKVLEVGCGMGATLAHIKYLWPKSEVHGIELVDKIVDVGSNVCDIIQGNIEEMDIPFEENSFDYIIFADVLEHLRDPEQIIHKVTKYLKHDGELLCSIPNIMHISVFMGLLRGQFEYQDQGILDRTHIHFFTYRSIYEMFARCGYELSNLDCVGVPSEDEETLNKIIAKINEVYETVSVEQFKVFQYIFSAKRKNIELNDKTILEE